VLPEMPSMVGEMDVMRKVVYQKSIRFDAYRYLPSIKEDRCHHGIFAYVDMGL
jgi:hypothetical protein